MTNQNRLSKKAFLRFWLRCIFFVPLFILILERMVWSFNVANNFPQETMLERRANDMLLPKPILIAETEPIAPYAKRSLTNLTRSLEKVKCEKGLKPKQDVFRQEGWLNNNATRRIPKIIHQTGRSRCMTRWMGDISNSWRKRLPDYEYYFHDDEAVDRLLNQAWPEFPHLPLVAKCANGTAKADLWRYVVLWEYGGIYADLDTSPTLFNSSTITDEDDGFFVVEQFHLLSQYFMALSPRHPLMLYAIHEALFKLMATPDTGRMHVPYTTGPTVLHAAFQRFMSDVGVKIIMAGIGALPVAPGHYVGTFNRSLVAAGKASNENEYVRRESLPRELKVEEYSKMGMEHFTFSQKRPSGISCREMMLTYAKRQI